jgi:hypothetical protein
MTGLVTIPPPDETVRQVARDQATIKLTNFSTSRVVAPATVDTVSTLLLEFYQNGAQGSQVAASHDAPDGWMVVARPQDPWFVSYLAQEQHISTQEAQRLVEHLNIVVVNNSVLSNIDGQNRLLNPTGQLFFVAPGAEPGSRGGWRKRAGRGRT